MRSDLDNRTREQGYLSAQDRAPAHECHGRKHRRLGPVIPSKTPLKAPAGKRHPKGCPHPHCQDSSRGQGMSRGPACRTSGTVLAGSVSSRCWTIRRMVLLRSAPRLRRHLRGGGVFFDRHS